MVVVMNFEHHLLDGATNITVLTDHQTLKGCLTPNLNERQLSSVNKFPPYDFHIFIEKEHWWSIRWRPVGPFNRDAWKAWYTTSSEPWKEFFVLVWNFLPRLPCPSGALGQRMYWWRRQKRTWNRHVAAIWKLPEGRSCFVPQYHSSSRR